MANIGDKLQGFILQSQDNLLDIRSTGELWIHETTGAQVYKVSNNDPENLFSFGFRTPPTDSTGVAHIIEHAVLAGSRSYPTKDPFLYLLKSSLQTFLNAMTYPDKTLYPASSMVEKDYFNLMEVYADAVFFPLLKQEIFSQEGHRLAFTPEGELEYTGVVFNEMKGNYSSAESVMGESCLQSLCESGPYSHDSGGNPLDIPDLTYEAFKAFHSTNYHPSNCQVLLYGCFDLEPQLELLNRRFFSNFKAQEPSPIPTKQKPWSQTKELRIPVPAQEGDSGTTLAMNWLTCGPLDQENYFLLDLLSDLLLGDAGVLARVLMDSGLGEDISPLSGYETDVLEGNFTIALRGCKEDSLEAFRNLVLESLASYVKDGLPEDLVEATLTAYEFSLKEVRGSGRGLRVLRRLYRSWNYGISPGVCLAFSSQLDCLRERLAKKEPVIQNLIQTLLSDNSHRADMIFYPDNGYAVGLEKKLSDRLIREKETLTESKIQAIRKNSELLDQFQTTPDTSEDQATLPQLGRADLPRKIEILQSQFHNPGFPLFIHEGSTNDVAYLDLAVDASGLTEEDYFYTALLTRVADGLGLVDLDYDLLARKIQLTTGGLSFRFNADQGFSDGQLKEIFWIRMKMLSRKIEPSFDLLKDILFHQDWNNLSRLKDLVMELKNQYQSAVMPQGHHFTSLRASSQFHLPSWLTDRMGGLGQLAFLQELSLTLETNGALEGLRDRLKSVWEKLLIRGRIRANITGEETFLPDFQNSLEILVQSIPEGKVYAQIKSLPPMEDQAQVFLAPVSVGHNAWAFPSTGDTRSHPGELFLAHLWRTTTLWETIRMKGGAYGAFSSAHPSEGYFSFGSYRDPKVIETYQSFIFALEQSAAKLLTKSELDLALVGVVGQELSPLSPGEEGYLYFSRWLRGISDEQRQERRDGYFNLSAKDLQKITMQLLELSKEGFQALIVSPETWETQSSGWKGRPPVIQKLNL